MVTEQASLPRRRPGGLSLDQRLRLHRYLSATNFALQRVLCLFLIVVFTAGPLILLMTAIHSIIVILAIVYGYFFALAGFVAYTQLWWERNVIEIAKQNSLAAVGPLLDLASHSFLLKYKPASAPETDSEAKVFTYLPDLLARMPAGDGPALSSRQQQALQRLIISPRYGPRFAQRTKWDALLSE